MRAVISMALRSLVKLQTWFRRLLAWTRFFKAGLAVVEMAKQVGCNHLLLILLSVAADFPNENTLFQIGIPWKGLGALKYACMLIASLMYS